MKTPSRRAQIHDALTHAGVFYDRLTAKKDGTFEVRRSYYYRVGQGCDGWATTVAKALPGATVTARDDFAQWPKTSYFTAVVRV